MAKEEIDIKENIDRANIVAKKYLARDIEDAGAKAARDVYKRALILLGQSNMQINDGNDISSKLPLTTYLNHGGRCIIEIPQIGENETQQDQVFNWLTSGKIEESKLLGNEDNQFDDPKIGSFDSVIDDSKVVYKRSAATHGIKWEGKKVKETKGFLIGLRSYILTKITWLFDILESFKIVSPRSDTERKLGTHHFGVDLNIKEGYHDPGENGHLYIHYTRPTKDRSGCIMFGVENAAPYSSKHSIFGRPQKESAFGGMKRDKLQKLAVSSRKYEMLPTKYDGVVGSISTDQIKQLTELKKLTACYNESRFAEAFTEPWKGNIEQLFETLSQEGNAKAMNTAQQQVQQQNIKTSTSIDSDQNKYTRNKTIPQQNSQHNRYTQVKS